MGLSYMSKCLNENVEIIAYIDNYSRDTVDDDGIAIMRESDIQDGYDYIIITLIHYNEIKEHLVYEGIPYNRIICFFDDNDADNSSFDNVLDVVKWKTELMWRYNRDYIVPLLNNLYYEINSDILLTQKKIPHIMDVESTIDEVVRGKKSLVRFGDGEFEMIRKQQRMRFQRINQELSERLREVLNSNCTNIVLCIADNYGSLKEYTDEAAAAIRQYLSPKVRRDHMELLDMKKKYGNAYLTRPYFMFRNKDPKEIKRKFDNLKRIWRTENVLIIEGEHTRFGVGNDLLDGTKSVVRILVPDKNAYNVYYDILAKAEEHSNNRLVLCIIGPTATVLSYDLTKKGKRAIDIGQVDSEYEWFLRGAQDRCDVPYKTVSEYVDKNFYEELGKDMADKYLKEIVDRIGI